MRIPSYRLHRASGQAVVTLDGRDIYLGPHGSPESRRLYEQRVAEWLAAGRSIRPTPGGALTVAEIAAAYWSHARQYYVKDGKPTQQQDRIRRSLDVMLALYATTRAAEFGPLRLKAVRQKMIEKGWCRRVINTNVGCLKRVFKWAVSEELCPPSVFHGLQTVVGLEAGRSAATEHPDVPPAPEDAIEAVRAIVSRQIRGLIDLQLWTGARPGEAITIRPCDLTRDGRVNLGFGSLDLGAGVWVYRPASHKTQHHGHQRVLLLGPRAQAAVEPFLDRDPTACCFSPAEAMADHHARLAAERQTPMSPSQRRRHERRMARQAQRRKKPGACYTRDSYRRAIEMGCAKAAVTSWSPHQLRHNAATRLVALFGWEIARIVLGHRSVEMTRIYAADDLRKAADAVRQAG